MSLDVVMVGENEITEALEDQEFALLVNFIQSNYPDKAHTDLGILDEKVKDGHPVGNYSAIHILRGLAVAVEHSPDRVEAMSEEDFDSIIERYYDDPDSATQTFRHLIEHPDDCGYYVPFELEQPLMIQAQMEDEEDPIIVAAGSSLALLQELDALNEYLQMPGDAGDLPQEQLEAILSNHRWPTAAHVWSVLHLYAKESVEKFQFIVFC